MKGPGYIFHEKVGKYFFPVDADTGIFKKRRIHFNVVQHNLDIKSLIDKRGAKFYNDLLRSFVQTFTMYVKVPIAPWRLGNCVLVISDKKLDFFKQIVSKYQLQEHEAFIFFLIANLEVLYCGKSRVGLNDNPGRSSKRDSRIKAITEIQQNVNALKSAIASLNSPKKKGKNSSDIKSIVFYSPKHGNMVVSDPFLIACIGDGIIEGLQMRNRTIYDSIDTIVHRFIEHDLLTEHFDKGVSKAFHAFFKLIDAFDFQQVKIKSQELFAITEILHVLNYRFRDDDGDEIDISNEIYRESIKRRVQSLISNP